MHREGGYQRDGYGRDNRERYGSKNRGYGSRTSFSSSLEPIREENQPVEFEKNFYAPTKTLDDAQAKKMREESNMQLIGKEVAPPVRDFDSLGFPASVLEYFTRKGFKEPTPIQAQGWPMALSGRDMVGIADTGSGKTISFVLPALVHAKAQAPLRRNDGPIVLILAPTRELCNQIQEVVAEYSGFFGLQSHAVYGGAALGPQKSALLRGVEVLVATPGRLIDLHDQGFCPLGRVTFLVLDEADRMLDMGFEPQLQQIIPKTNPGRQTLMWSATWPREVRNLANDYMKEFIQVTIGDDNLRANMKIQQEVEVVDHRTKMDKLCTKLEETKEDKVIVFCNTKRMCDEIETYLFKKDFRAAAIHGDKSQSARDSVIRSFKSGRNNILIATDVAARGLDVNDVKLVINYDFPKCVDDYIHRIGRTARGSSTEGFSYTMFTRDDRGVARKLIEVLRQAKQKVSAELAEMATQGGSYNRYGGGRNGQSRGGSSWNGSRGRRFGY